MKYSKGDLAKAILKGLVAGGFLTLSLALPNFPQVLKLFKDNNAKSKYKIRRAFYSLKKNRLVDIYEKNGIDVVEITQKGRKKVLAYKLDEIKIKKSQRWDGFWRVIIFDIPERHRSARRALSFKLKEVGLYPLQRSVFIGPFECLNEINFIGEFLG